MKTTRYILAILVTSIFTTTALLSQEAYELLFLNGSYDEILAISEDKNSAEDVYWRALITDKQGNSTEAIEIINDGLLVFGKDEKLEMLLIEIQYKLGRYSQTLPLLKEHLDYPGNFMRYINILEFQGDYNEAIKLLEEVYVLDSTNLEYLVHLGDNYFQIDRELSSIWAFNKILEINPYDIQSTSKLANLYVKIQKYKAAINVCDQGLKIDSTSKRLYRAKGIAYNKMEDHKNAEKCFQYLFSHGDSSQFIVKNLGISEFFTYSYDESIEHLLLAYENDPNDFEVCYVLGKDYLNSDDPEPGLYYFSRADTLLQPDTKTLSSVHNEKQQIYTLLSDFENAVASYAKAYEYNPKPEYLFFMASMYQHQLKDKQKAYEMFLTFLEVLPEQKDGDSDDLSEDETRTISLKEVAERNVEKLKEELFFEGGL